MVKQKIILIGPEDMARIRVMCAYCKSELVFDLSVRRPFPDC